jgi:PAS domain S-box-containing protein
MQATPPGSSKIDLIEELPVAVVVTDSTGDVVEMNGAATELVGLSREACLGKKLTAFIDAPLEADHGEALLSRARLRRQDGSYRVIDRKIRTLADGRTVNVLHDVTAAASEADALRESERQLQFVANTVPALLAFVDNDARYVWVNESYRRWFGQAPETILGRHVREILGEAPWEQVRHRIERVLAGEAVVFENRALYRHGPARDVQVAYLPHRDAGGRVHGFVVLVTDVGEIKSAEQALRRSENMLAESQVAAHVGSWEAVLDSEQNRTSLRWSDETYRIFGLVPGIEIVHQHFRDAIHPDDREQVASSTRTGIARGGRFEKEYRIVRPDGTVRVIHSWTNVEADVGGRPARLLGTCQDVTEHRIAEQEIQRVREQLQLVVDTTPALIARCDGNRRLVWANRSYAARFGKEPEDMVGTSLSALVGAEAYPVVASVCHRVMSGETVDLETEVSYPTLGRRFIQMVAAPTRDGSGAPDGCVAVITDVTHRHELERALRLGEERYRSLVGAITSVVWAAGADGRFVEPQALWESYTGQPWGQHQGRGWVDAIHPHDRAEIERLYTEADPADGFEQSACRVWHAPSGNYRNCERSAVAIRNPDGSIREWIGTLVDVHERERALQELQEANRQKDEFLAMLSHELRNPLAPILSAVEVLRLAGPDDPDLAARSRAVIARQVNLMKHLLDDLLDVSRVSQGKIALRKELLDLGGLLLHAVEVSRPLIAEKRQRLSMTTAPGTILVDADATRLVQVFANLLNNAAKYSDPGGHIELEMSVTEHEALVRVRDDGVGMPPDLLDRVFDLFVQETRSLDRAQGGLGIGLTMARSLVRMHGGSVRAFSDGPGCGSEVVVRLPRAAAEAPTAIARAPSGPLLPGTSEPLRVLVVDDNVDAAGTLGDLLTLMGHQVTLAPDGRTALSLVAAADPALVLIDIGLPEMDGYALARALREAGLVHAALIAVTGYGREEDLRRSKEAGFDDHLVKPIDLATLRRITTRPADRDS